jgi:hypothetical protein
MDGTRRLRLLLLASCVALGPAGASAQSDPAAILRSVILQLQTGQPNRLWYGDSMWFLMAAQTNGSGVYPQLVQLGLVEEVLVTATLPLPLGVVYTMTAEHQYGTSDWEFAISSLTNRIEHIGFMARPRQVGVPPAPRPERDRPPDDPPPAPGNTSEACAKFPNLC